MKIYNLTFILAILICISSCKEEKKSDAERDDSEITDTESNNMENNGNDVPSNKQVAFPLVSKSGSDVTGEVAFVENDGVITMKATLNGLSEGKHAIHIHEKADCSSDDGKSTGGHWNPTAEPHGKWGDEGGYHKGDIGNFNADAEGNAEVSMSTDEWCIGCDDETKNILGKAIIVHQGVDDFTSQPSGAAGTRISCGGIIK